MQKTSVTFLLDRTGSMERIKKDTIGGFNAYLEGLAEGDAADNTKFTLVTFDSVSIDKVCVSEPVKQVAKLTDATYQPRAWTPLIDAAYKTIKAVETAVAGSDKKVVIVIQTDGEENASQEHTWIELNDLIKEKTKLGWQFNFLGVGIDAYKQASAMGIAAGSTISSTMDSAHQASAYRSMSGNTARYAAGQAESVTLSAAQKRMSGDFHDDDQTPSSSWGKFPKSKVSSKNVKQIVDDLDLTK